MLLAFITVSRVVTRPTTGLERGVTYDQAPITIPDDDSVTKYYYHGSKRVAMKRGADVHFLHGDHLGSTSLTTDSTGGVVHEARFLPFGGEHWSTGTEQTDFTYTGQRAESGFGLMDYNARYYSSRLGRFTSPDTIVPDFADPQSFNRYSYVRNNSLKYTDPSGHCRDCMFFNDPMQMIGSPNVRRVGEVAVALAIQSAGTAVSVSSQPTLEPFPLPAPGSEHFEPISSENVTSPSAPDTTLIVPPFTLPQEELPIIVPGVEFGQADPNDYIFTTSKELAQNMKDAGFSQPLFTAAHHIVAENHRGAAAARAILAKEGIDINSADNGVFLAQNSLVPNLVGGAIHSKLHTNEYFDAVLQELQNAEPGTLRSVLRSIGDRLKDDTFPY